MAIPTAPNPAASVPAGATSQNAKPKEPKLTMGYGFAFVTGVAAIAAGLVGIVASCALLPFAPAAAIPVAITCAATLIAGIRLFVEAHKAIAAEQLAKSQQKNSMPSPRPRE